jgi:translation initiation factor IF-2
LVVAADDGVMPQTIEAINHARDAKVPIVVAVNKIDKPEANPERVETQLSERGLVPEKWGGDTVMVPVSALKRQGIDELLEMVLLMAEMGELKANPDRPAMGVVIEAKVDKGRGPVATVLIQKGTLRVGDYFLVGEVHGRVRAMADYKGRAVSEATPSMPVEVLGLSDVPLAGDAFQVVIDEREAKQVAARRAERRRVEEIGEAPKKVSLEDLFSQIKEGEVKELRVIIKADVQGSVEAVRQAIEQLSTDEVRVDVIHGGVGAISESDIMLASASNAVVIGFNVRPDAVASMCAEDEKVDVRLYRVIYEAIDDVKKALEGLLEPEYREVVYGRAEVRATFKVPRAGVVAGCYVTDGKVPRSALVRVVRDGIVEHEGKIASLRRFKDDVREVVAGFECGIGIEDWNDVRESDVIEAYGSEEVKREL